VDDRPEPTGRILQMLEHEARPAHGEPDGLLVLHHGRGSDERDLLGLADVLDPDGRLHVVTPRAPLQLPGMPGHHWYVVPRVGYPDPETFAAAYAELARFHDALWESTGIEPARTVLGGFSMGAVMSHAAGWGPGRPSVAGIAAFSGFIPVVEGWDADLAGHASTRALVSHGSEDPVIPVGFGRQARDTLHAGSIDVEWQEGPFGHWIEQEHLQRATSWLGEVLPPR
jgi:phospholipase/carboxylesterase